MKGNMESFYGDCLFFISWICCTIFQRKTSYIQIYLMLPIMTFIFLVLSFPAINLISDDTNQNTIQSSNKATNTCTSYGVIFDYPSNWTIISQSKGKNNYIIVKPLQRGWDDPQFQVSIEPNPVGKCLIKIK